MFKILFLSALMFFFGYRIITYLFSVFGGNKQNRSQNNNQNRSNSSSKEDKHYTKDIGEYVSYEEIKDDEKK